MVESGHMVAISKMFSESVEARLVGQYHKISYTPLLLISFSIYNIIYI